MITSKVFKLLQRQTLKHFEQTQIHKCGWTLISGAAQCCWSKVQAPNGCSCRTSVKSRRNGYWCLASGDLHFERMFRWAIDFVASTSFASRRAAARERHNRLITSYMLMFPGRSYILITFSWETPLMIRNMCLFWKTISAAMHGQTRRQKQRYRILQCVGAPAEEI